jgi:hypothetical protein
VRVDDEAEGHVSNALERLLNFVRQRRVLIVDHHNSLADRKTNCQQFPDGDGSGSRHSLLREVPKLQIGLGERGQAMPDWRVDFGVGQGVPS